MSDLLTSTVPVELLILARDRIEELEAENKRLSAGWGLAASFIPAARWEDYKRRRDELKLLVGADA